MSSSHHPPSSIPSLHAFKLIESEGGTKPRNEKKGEPGGSWRPSSRALARGEMVYVLYYSQVQSLANFFLLVCFHTQARWLCLLLAAVQPQKPTHTPTPQGKRPTSPHISLFFSVPPSLRRGGGTNTHHKDHSKYIHTPLPSLPHLITLFYCYY